MNRKELINQIAANLKISKKLTGEVLLNFVKVVSQELKKGQMVTFTSFGTFRVSQRKKRECVLPQDKNKRIKIKACKTPVFRAGTPFKKFIR